MRSESLQPEQEKISASNLAFLQSESGELKTRHLILNRLAGSSYINCITDVSQAKKEAPGVTTGIPLFTCNISAY